MLKITKSKKKSVLCIGYINEQRRKKLINNHQELYQYNERLRFLYRKSILSGCDTFIFMSWDYFTLVSAGILNICTPAIIKDFNLEYVFSMAVLDEETITDNFHLPPINNYFNEIIIPRRDFPDTSFEQIVESILNNVSVVIYDDIDAPPMIQSIIVKAFAYEKKMLDVNFKL